MPVVDGAGVAALHAVEAGVGGSVAGAAEDAVGPLGMADGGRGLVFGEVLEHPLLLHARWHRTYVPEKPQIGELWIGD